MRVRIPLRLPFYAAVPELAAGDWPKPNRRKSIRVRISSAAPPYTPVPQLAEGPIQRRNDTGSNPVGSTKLMNGLTSRKEKYEISRIIKEDKGKYYQLLNNQKIIVFTQSKTRECMGD